MGAGRAILVASACNVRTICLECPDLDCDSRDSEAWVSGVRFALLGTLMLAGGAGDPVGVCGARQRALLASLLLSANVPVSYGALAEAVWDGSPPPGAATTLRRHIRRLRQALGPQAGRRITARDPGYLISVREPELDVLGFEAACADAGAARRRPGGRPG